MVTIMPAPCVHPPTAALLTCLQLPLPLLLSQYGGYDEEDDAFGQLGSFGVTAAMAFFNRGFKEMYKCYAVAMMPGNERENVNYGGKSKYMLAQVPFGIASAAGSISGRC
ncbi:hypothetical protein BC937DRAFT_95337, partial [Endogone sp. FLAS-F59071]